MVTIGEKIRLYREGQGYSQQDFAQKIGVTKGHLSRIESGQEKLSASLQDRIAQALGMDARKLKPTLSRAQKTNYLRILTEEELMCEYNQYHAILIRLLHSSDDGFDDLFPAILDIGNYQKGEIVAVYSCRKEVLYLQDYGTEWIAYHYHEDLVNEERNNTAYEE